MINNKQSDREMRQFIQKVDHQIDELDNSVNYLNESMNRLERKIHRMIEYSRLEAVDLEQINDLELRVAELEKEIKVHGRLAAGLFICTIFLFLLLLGDIFFWNAL